MGGMALALTLACGLPSFQPTPTAEPTSVPTETATPVPAATATPDTPYIFFRDDFSDPASGWDRATFPNGVTDYGNSSYRITALGPGQFLWSTPNLDLVDVRLRVTAKWVDGDADNAFGVVCRHVNEDNFYVLMVTSDGFAGIRRRLNGGELETLTGEGSFTRIRGLPHGGNVRLMAKCVGTTLSLFANEQLLLETEDDALAHGDVGVAASVFDAASATVDFYGFSVEVIP